MQTCVWPRSLHAALLVFIGAVLIGVGVCLLCVLVGVCRHRGGIFDTKYLARRLTEVSQFVALGLPGSCFTSAPVAFALFTAKRTARCAAHLAGLAERLLLLGHAPCGPIASLCAVAGAAAAQVFEDTGLSSVYGTISQPTEQQSEQMQALLDHASAAAGSTVQLPVITHAPGFGKYKDLAPGEAAHEAGYGKWAPALQHEYPNTRAMAL